MSEAFQSPETNPRTFELEPDHQIEVSPKELAEVIGGGYLRALTSASPTSTSLICTCPKSFGPSPLPQVAPSVYGS